MRPEALRTNSHRLLTSIDQLATLGRDEHGGSTRLALTSADQAGREWILDRMRALDLQVEIDLVGNITGTWNVGTGAPVMTGSHIDTVRRGGPLDGNLGVLAGLETIQTCRDHGLFPSRPLAVTVFSNEEGVRYAPDMLGSAAYVGHLSADDALSTTGIDGTNYGEELSRIGFRGTGKIPGTVPHAFIELHIEQGPVLDSDDLDIGVVTGVQGIWWTRYVVTGQANHAGTTPMSHRHDAGYVAATTAAFVRDLTTQPDGLHMGTVGSFAVQPDLVNVVAAQATFTTDLRDTDTRRLTTAQQRVDSYLAALAESEGVTIERDELARFEPVSFDSSLSSLIERLACELDLTSVKLSSGAGHDAQMLAQVCPAAMIFVPSSNGVSHNPAEHTDDHLLVAGADLLLATLLSICYDGLP